MQDFLVRVASVSLTAGSVMDLMIATLEKTSLIVSTLHLLLVPAQTQTLKPLLLGFLQTILHQVPNMIGICHDVYMMLCDKAALTLL